MAKTVLVPIEGSPLSTRALQIALTDYPEAEIVVCHVMDPVGSGFGIIEMMRPRFEDGSPPGSVSPEYWREWHDKARGKAEDIFDEAREIAAKQERSIDTVLEFGTPEDVIVEFAESNDLDRIVMGSNCRSGAERFLLGSVAEKTVKRAPVPVMIVR